MDIKKISMHFLIVCIIISACLLLYSFFVLEKVIVVPMNINVSGSYGFNLDADSLHFGNTVPGGESQRGFVVSNHRKYPLLASVIKEGEIAGWVEIKDSRFVVPPYENRSISATVYVPNSVPEGFYTGNIKVILRKKWF